MKKGISENKVKRMRNIVRGNYTERTRIQSGYNKVSVEHKEGDVWEERGKVWTIKNGIKQNITKLDQARKKIKVPLSCPKCGGEMNHHLSKYYWTKLGMCKNCAVKFHTRLKIDGKWDDYVKRIQDDNFEFYINELKKEYEDWLQSVDSKYITEAGIVEDWSGGKTKKELSKGFEERLKKLEISHGNPKGTDRETN